jgi:hypothetical protein
LEEPARLLLGDEATTWLGQTVWVFLAGDGFAAKIPGYEGWISLDSLIRIETWVTRIFAGMA